MSQVVLPSNGYKGYMFLKKLHIQHCLIIFHDNFVLFIIILKNHHHMVCSSNFYSSYSDSSLDNSSFRSESFFPIKMTVDNHS